MASISAYQKIKDMIFRMELMPGDRIPEAQIAAKLSVSRTPVHDALRRLEADGLVTISPNRGATVTQFSDQEVREIGTIRLAQDILSAELAAYYGSAADFDALRVIAEHCEAETSRGNAYERIRLDNEFHMSITKISGNRQLIAQQYALAQQIQLIQISKYTDAAHSLCEIRHHKPLVEAIAARNDAAIRQLICEHLKDYYQIDPFILSCCGYHTSTQAD